MSRDIGIADTAGTADTAGSADRFHRRGYDARGGRHRRTAAAMRNCYPHFGRRTRLSRPLIGTGPHRHRSSEYGRGPEGEGNSQN